MIEVIKLEDDDGVQDADFLSLLEAAEADALASAGKIKRQKISSSAVSDRETAEIEGSYAAALRGSRSSLWQQQQELLHPQRKSKENSSSFTVTGGGSGDACFKCGLSGHWARDCTVASGVGVGGGGGGRGGEGSGHGGSMVDDADAVAEKPCPCGSGICLVLTSNTAKNPGRKFYRCPVKEENGGCNFFEWCDNPSSGVPTSGRASTEGRGSYSVSKWSSESSFMSRQTSFPSQAQSTYNSYSSSRSSGERNSSSCFKCGQEGHWARDCTKSSSTNSYANMGGSHLASSGSGSCFKCGKTGHWARDCTAQDFSAGAGSGDRKASRSFRTPFPNKY